MKILAVEDDPVARAVLVRTLRKLGHEVLTVSDGLSALEVLAGDPVRVVVSDWVMPGVDGLELCRRLRARPGSDYVYFILLTGKLRSDGNQREAIEAGVDDFLQKPLSTEEIWMRLHVAERILRYSTQVRQLEAFLPICGYCKKIRDDRNYWQQIESYINARTGTDFSHSVCPDCYGRIVLPQLEQISRETGLPLPTLPPRPPAPGTPPRPAEDPSASSPRVRRTH